MALRIILMLMAGVFYREKGFFRNKEHEKIHMDISVVLPASFQCAMVHCIFSRGRVRIDIARYSDLISSGADSACFM